MLSATKALNDLLDALCCRRGQAGCQSPPFAYAVLAPRCAPRGFAYAACMPNADCGTTEQPQQARFGIVYDYACGMLRSLQARLRRNVERLPDQVLEWATCCKVIVDPFHFGPKAPSGGHKGAFCYRHVNPADVECVKDRDHNNQACEQGFKRWNKQSAGCFRLSKEHFEFDLLAGTYVETTIKHIKSRVTPE